MTRATSYEMALAILDRLLQINPAVGTPEGGKLELILSIVKKYEAARYWFAPPTPIEALQFRAEQEEGATL